MSSPLKPKSKSQLKRDTWWTHTFCIPTPQQILNERKHFGLTQQQAATLIQASRPAWSKWELGQVRMHPAKWELFLIKAIEANLSKSQ